MPEIVMIPGLVVRGMHSAGQPSCGSECDLPWLGPDFA